VLTVRSDAQQLARTSPPRFRSNVDLVTLDVCVKDRSGRFVPLLEPQDFLVLEDGIPQQLSFVWPSNRVPVAATLLLDRSASMAGGKMRYVRDAAGTFIDGLGINDRISLLAFAGRTERVADFDDDRAVARARSVEAESAGSTAMYDAVIVALTEIARHQRTRMTEMRDVLVVLSDGEDNSSMIDFEELITAVRRSGVLVYTVVPAPHDRPTRRPGLFTTSTVPPWPLGRLAADSGGRAIGSSSLEGLPALFEDIRAEVSHLYRLGYVSANERRDGAWRSVTVRVPGKDVIARTRTGYLAPRNIVR
jgi:VWFA-related protein